MKKLFLIMAVLSAMAFPVIYSATGSDLGAQAAVHTEKIDRFEQAVEIIKKYETLHQPRHWPLVGYGHKVLPGEKFSRTKALSEPEADKLLRKDLLKLCAIFRSYGKDSLLLATLAYNIGHGAVNRSTVIKKLKEGDRNIRENYIAHCRYKGKVHSQIQKRRIEEFEKLFVTETARATAPARHVARALHLNPARLLASELRRLTQFTLSSVFSPTFSIPYLAF